MAEELDQLQQIQQIRSMMERSSRFISLSGLAGVFAGIFALIGAGAFYMFIHSKFNSRYAQLAQVIPVEIDLSIIQFVILDAAAILFFSIVFAIFFTTRKARSMGQTIWDATARRMILSLALPLVTGGVYCLVLLKYHWFGLIAPTTLVFYGLALVNAGKHTLDEIKYLGISEIVLGIIGLFFIGYGITLWVIGFGILHIIYGLMMYARYEAKPQEKKYW